MKIQSKSVEEHAEVPLPDDGRWERLVHHFSAQDEPRTGAPETNRCFVVSVHHRGSRGDPVAQLDEMLGLVRAQGDRVVGQKLHELVHPDPRTLLRKGVAERIAQEAREAGPDAFVLDGELSPSQARNLEDVVGLPVWDREAVILNVFERNARSKRARLQVEIARLTYLRPRIRGIGLDMDQQMGGIKGGRGPGETASELLARRLDGRLDHLRGALARIKESDAATRKHRSGAERVALVGYTNAGKTSLMNALTTAELSARDSPFETLETTSRALTRHGGDVLLSDTVGFIRHLPERLFASFESTLAEATEATWLLLVVDVADPEHGLHLETTEAVLDKLGAASIPRFYAFNKVDLLEVPADPSRLKRVCGHAPHALVSARDPESVERLRDQLLVAVRRRKPKRTFLVPYERATTTRLVYATCRVLHVEAKEAGLEFTVEAEPHVVRRIEADLEHRR